MEELLQPTSYHTELTENGSEAVLVGGCSDAEVYKRLYHDTVERYSNLQEQLEKYKGLFSKLQRIDELKEVALTLIDERKVYLESGFEQLEREKQQWKEKLKQSQTEREHLTKECIELQQVCSTFEKEHIQTCARLVTELALARAVGRVQAEESKELVKSKETELSKLKKKMSKYSYSLKRAHKEVSESLDFSEAERSTLVEVNTDLEKKLATLKSISEENQRELKEKSGTIEETRRLLEEERSRTQELMAQIQANTVPVCSGCSQMKADLEVALKALNDRGTAKYGDLLRENFALRQNLNAAKSELSRGMSEFERLTQYIQDYKIKSSEKVCILKENLCKADQEISELDALIDRIREVMHSEIDTVKHCPNLLHLIRELDGSEAPEMY